MLSLSFRKRVWALLFITVTVLLLLIAGYFNYTLSDTLHHQIGTRAVVQARAIASDPELCAAMESGDDANIRQQIARLQRLSDANFIVVGDKSGVRLAHPDPNKVGLPMKGGDSIRALKEGRHYYSTRKGSLGFSIRGKSPIVSSQGEIIGVVSVGYLLDTIGIWHHDNAYPFFVALLVILLCSILGAWWFSSHIKKQMNGMEPEEIATSLRVKNSVFEAIYEGIVAVDKEGRVISVNQQALKILGIVQPIESMHYQEVEQYITPSHFFVGLKFNGECDESEYQHQEIACNGEALVATRVRMWEGDTHSGWVVSFRPKNDTNALISQLNEVKQQTNSLRVVSHEYANKLSIIGGMIQIGAYDQALSTIRQETETHQNLIDFVHTSFNSKVIAGILLGKYSRARELGLTLEFDPYCQLQHPPRVISEEELAAVIGNILDNAFEASLKNPDSNKTISIFITDDSQKELVVEIADNGLGIPAELEESLFNQGVSSKEKSGHGIGLYIVHHYVTRVGGTILIDSHEPSGTIFSLFIPNENLLDAGVRYSA